MPLVSCSYRITLAISNVEQFFYVFYFVFFFFRHDAHEQVVNSFKAPRPPREFRQSYQNLWLNHQKKMGLHDVNAFPPHLVRKYLQISHNQFTKKKIAKICFFLSLIFPASCFKSQMARNSRRKFWCQEGQSCRSGRYWSTCTRLWTDSRVSVYSISRIIKKKKISSEN